MKLILTPREPAPSPSADDTHGSVGDALGASIPDVLALARSLQGVGASMGEWVAAVAQVAGPEMTRVAWRTFLAEGLIVANDNLEKLWERGLLQADIDTDLKAALVAEVGVLCAQTSYRIANGEVRSTLDYLMRVLPEHGGHPSKVWAHMPEGLDVKGGLHLRPGSGDTEQIRLPRGLTVHGHLKIGLPPGLDASGMVGIGECTTVHGDLVIEQNVATSVRGRMALPAQLCVTGDLITHQWAGWDGELPRDCRVGGRIQVGEHAFHKDMAAYRQAKEEG